MHCTNCKCKHCSEQALRCLCLAKHALLLNTKIQYNFSTDGKVLIWEPERFFTEYENVEQVVQEASFPSMAFINTLLFF